MCVSVTHDISEYIYSNPINIRKAQKILSFLYFPIFICVNDRYRVANNSNYLYITERGDYHRRYNLRK